MLVCVHVCVRVCVPANWRPLFIVFHMFAYKVKILVKRAVKMRLISSTHNQNVPLAALSHHTQHSIVEIHHPQHRLCHVCGEGHFNGLGTLTHRFI